MLCIVFFANMGYLIVISHVTMCIVQIFVSLLDEDCAALTVFGIWNPTKCETQLPYVCESESQGSSYTS